MATKARARKVAERIQEELADILMRNVADPRLAMVTITAVDVDRELAYAQIYVVASGDDERMDDVLAGLEGAQGYLRSQLAARIQLRSFPQLRFRWDASHERGARIEELLDSLQEERGEKAGDVSGGNDD
ncbi:MAG: 30S ribosome-binding factor RbfA [Anaerolineales bacterium]|nr:MAG: 30S ribosome-binding factor RbfA [Anaerolineales bacterium]